MAKKAAAAFPAAKVRVTRSSKPHEAAAISSACPIVGSNAWAGGQEAVTRLSKHLRPDVAMVFATAALRANEERFRALVENCAEGICTCTAHGRLQYVSASTTRILGFAPEQMMGKSVVRFLHPDDVGRLKNEVAALFTAPVAVTKTRVLRAQHASGAWRWIECVFTNLVDNPAVCGLVVNFRDITEQRQFEETLTEQAQLIHLSHDTILVRRLDGTITFWNHGAEATYGWTAASAIGKSAHHLLKTRFPKPLSDIAAELLQHDRWEGELVHTKADGTRIIVSSRWALQRNEHGEPVAILEVNDDITARKKAEREREDLLAQVEQERARLAVQCDVVRALSDADSIEEAAPKILRAFCDNIGWHVGGFWLVNPAKQELQPVCIWHQPGAAAEAFCAQSEKTVFGKGTDLPGRVWLDRRPTWVPDFTQVPSFPRSGVASGCGLHAGIAFPVMAGKKVLGVIEFLNREVRNPQKSLLTTISAMGGQIGLFIQRAQAQAAVRDSEEALRRINNELENRVRERTAWLSLANEELCKEINERNRLERELLSVSEREQRTLGQDLHDGVCQELAAIAFMSRALAKRLTNRQIPEAADVDRIAGHVNEAVAHVRDVARGLHPVEMDSGGLMAALRDLAASANGGVRCEFECKKPIAMRESSIALNLYRIAQEAVANALKHAQASSIIVFLTRSEKKVMLTVRDDGIGLGNEPRDESCGMGMHILRYRARTIGASLSIENAKPKGTQVRCSLPMP